MIDQRVFDLAIFLHKLWHPCVVQGSNPMKTKGSKFRKSNLASNIWNLVASFATMTGVFVSSALGRSRSLFTLSWRIPRCAQIEVRRISSSSLCSSQTKLTTTHHDKDVEESDEPIKFTTSSAFRPATAGPNNLRRKPPPFWAQGYILQVSLCAFLLYFCVFREENDIDLKLKVDLGEPDAEEQLLELEKRGADVKLLREQLFRIRQIELKIEDTLPS